MRETRIIFIAVVLVVLGLALAAPARPAGRAYLPKVDLIKGSGPEVYAFENGDRRWIESPAAFAYFNYDWKNIKLVSESVLDSYPQEENLGKYDDYPDGSLLRGSGPEVYLIELGKKRWIPTPAIFTANNFGWKYIVRVEDKILEDIKPGSDLTISEPNRYPNTIILDGPGQNEVIEDSEVAFKFSGTNPLGPTAELSFETFLSGDDDYWRSSSGDDEEYRLLSNAVYTFYVRAKNKQGYVDPSPASIQFSIELSSYYGQVAIDRVDPDRDDFRQDYLILRNDDKDERIINLTGWKIETKKTTIVIPQAIEKLKPIFSAQDSSDINLPYDGEVIISFGASPYGVNFQTNLCSGYQAQNYEFFPSLDSDCPQPEEADYSGFKKTCCDFIENLDQCKIPNYGNNFDVSVDSQCTNFLNDNFNYQGCYNDHSQEVDFFDNEWRVFLNKSEDILDNDSETIILKDKSGQVVDIYSY